jgi:hypothetical protein
MSQVVDPNAVSQLLRATLLASASVTDLVENRIHGGWARDADAGTIQAPAIAVVLDGGPVHWEGYIGRLGAEVWGLSSVSQSEAHAVYQAAAEVLHSETLHVEGINHRGSARAVGVPRIGWAPGPGLWYSMGRFVLQIVRTS